MMSLFRRALLPRSERERILTRLSLLGGAMIVVWSGLLVFLLWLNGG